MFFKKICSHFSIYFCVIKLTCTNSKLNNVKLIKLQLITLDVFKIAKMNQFYEFL